MSELFDSLNLSTSAGPSSSQQSSSQPSTSKVFWHASPSPGVLRQLANWTPSKSQESPTLPLCTQAFVGELKKLPGAYEAQSPLIARDSAKRKKLMDTSRGSARHVSDPTANRVKLREYINLELSEDEEEEEDGGSANGPRRLLLGDVGESSPESARRRTMDAGNTGRMRQPSTSSQHSSTHSHTSLPLDKDPPQYVSSHRRLERRPPRRRKKESLIAGLGFTDDSGRATDCLKLFEDLQAAIQGMQSASRPSTSEFADADQRPTVTFDGRSSGGASAGGRLTAREGINRTASAPHVSRTTQHSQQQQHEEDERSRSPDQQQKDSNGPLTPRRGFRPVKSDHDVFRAAGNARGSEIETRALQPRPINLPTEPRADSQSQQQGPPSKAPIQASTVLQPSEAKVEQQNEASPTAQAVPAEATKSTASSTVRASAIDAPTHATKTAIVAQPSPVKRSARIEAMQQTTHNTKKLGVRGPSMLSKSVSPHAKPACSTTHTLSRKPGPATTSNTATTPGRARAFALGKLSQARQPGLPRSCSQSIPASQHCPAAGGAVGPAAPFRPPAIAARATTTTRMTGREVRSSSPVKRSSSKAGPASSDDSFGDVDDDAAFLALACEFEY